MRAIRIHQTGGPEVLVLEEVELPPPGKGEVRIRHHAIGVNFLDTYHRTGFYPMPLPLTPGAEGAGEVVEVGAGVEGFKPGDRVVYAGPPGGYAEERNIPASFLLKLPREIDYDTGAAMMLKGLTAQYLLRQTYKVRDGDVILVHAAAGGVGQILCQWGRALGAQVIGTVGSADKAQIARKAGAHHTILYREEDFAARVGEITKGQKCAVVYDGVGRATFPASLDCLRPFGVFASFGSASGGIEAFDLGLLGRKGSLFATRPTLFTFMADRTRLEKMARDLFRAVSAGDVTIGIGRKLPLAQAAEAHRALEARETTGSIVLEP
ncbi:NADPH2:quinone reductase [Roseiarcus fermentans]|uniref:NADPH2:quinone reductase n=1 Tax=Roseiarcus fermentans TaxID=1473586 RepID=A0A366EU00_9HYPH|nr:quinone oxidoreductase [Roseiarcus fermentans]RBP05160.1 NADPH2:quinone reductase [Roseiarcus fermentans]